MSEIVKDPSAPVSIWLQTGGAYSVTRGSEDLTWSDEEIDDTDEKYVRADIAAALRTRAEEAEARVAELEAERDANTSTLSPQSLAWARAEAEKLEARDAAMLGVVVKELEWVEDVDGWGAVNPFNTDEFLYMAWPSRWQMTQEPCWELFEAPQTDDDELSIRGACFDELDALKTACQADYTRRILSAVNAVSEAQVQADERERVAKRAEAYVWPRLESCAQMREYVAQWLRAQEGGK